jgi:hypothetical protein
LKIHIRILSYSEADTADEQEASVDQLKLTKGLLGEDSLNLMRCLKVIREQIDQTETKIAIGRALI